MREIGKSPKEEDRISYWEHGFPGNSCSDAPGEGCRDPSNAHICPWIPVNAIYGSRSQVGSGLLQNPVALSCRWTFSLACTQSPQPHPRSCVGPGLGVCGAYSFNDRTWGGKEDEGEGERGLEIVYKELPRGMNSGTGRELRPPSSAPCPHFTERMEVPGDCVWGSWNPSS